MGSSPPLMMSASSPCREKVTACSAERAADDHHRIWKASSPRPQARCGCSARSRIGRAAWRHGSAGPPVHQLDQQLTVAETIRLFGRAVPNPFSLGEVLEMTGLGEDAHTAVGVLSGGQRRRAMWPWANSRPPNSCSWTSRHRPGPEARRHLWTVIENRPRRAPRYCSPRTT